jgi:hypothetical protein
MLENIYIYIVHTNTLHVDKGHREKQAREAWIN